MLFRFIFFGLSLFFPFCVHSTGSPILVQLETDQQLSPLYLAPFINEGESFQLSYVQQLEKILEFDLSHNAQTYIVPKTAQKNRLANVKSFENFGAAQEWSSAGVAYVVKVKLQDGKMSAKVLQVSNKTLKNFDSLSLTGNINQDRRQVHQLADRIHKALFGTPGIATTRVLYAYKYPITKQGKLDWISEIWEMDYDGGNAHKISEDSSGYCITPCFIPPKPGQLSSAYFFISYKNGQPKIYVSPIKGGEPSRLNYLRGNQLMPVISRQRDKLAFISDIAGNPDLFIQEFNPETGLIGKPRQLFSSRHATQGSPTFSPDGKQIAFVSNKDGHPRIYVLGISDSPSAKPRLISHANRESTAPCWSPDGTKLAYCARSGQDRQIWIYDFKTGEEWQLTSGKADKENPSWAPNSLHLMYNTTGKDVADLYMIDLKQRQPEKITSGKGEMRFPSWEPR